MLKVISVGARVIIKKHVMDPWGWPLYPPPDRYDGPSKVPIKDGAEGNVIGVRTISPDCLHVTIDYIDERNVLCRSIVEDQYVHPMKD